MTENDKTFRTLLLAELGNAVEAGDISRRDGIKARLRCFMPRTLRELRQVATVELMLDGHADAAGLIDWGSIDPDKLRAILIAILEFIVGIADLIG